MSKQETNKKKVEVNINKPLIKKLSVSIRVEPEKETITRFAKWLSERPMLRKGMDDQKSALGVVNLYLNHR